MQQLQILILDDHEPTAGTLVRLLAKAGHTTVGANHPARALELVTSQYFDLVISDIGMPDIDGWTLLGKIRSLQPHIRAIALTGYGYPKDVEKSKQVGFDFHITKPAELPALRCAIEQLYTSAGVTGHRRALESKL